MLALESLKNATSLSDLANLLGYQPKALSYILYKIPTSEKYEEFKISKKSGGERRIKAPTPQLKKLQARLAEKRNKCLEEISKHHNHKKSLSHGFREKHSIITNASNHSNGSIALSKTEYGKIVFAEKVVKANQNSINFDEFKSVFAAISEITDDYKLYT